MAQLRRLHLGWCIALGGDSEMQHLKHLTGLTSLSLCHTKVGAPAALLAGFLCITPVSEGSMRSKASGTSHSQTHVFFAGACVLAVLSLLA